MKPIIVQKYGGSSVADIPKVKKVAENVVQAAKQGYGVVVVVSAMGKTTDILMKMARETCSEPPRRELDMLLTTGERISMSLLSMAIQNLGHDAISFTGSQTGIITTDSHSNARIIEVRPFRIEDELERGRIVIVAGFQGVSYKREITTLGRGGSDTTAVALAAALGAERVEIFSDVDGVYSADPNVVPEAYRLDEIALDEMMQLSKFGAKVMAADAMEYARKKNIAIYAKGTRTPQAPGTVIRVNPLSDDRQFSAVAGKKDVVYLQFSQGSDLTGYEELFECLNTVGQQQLMPFMSHVSLRGTAGATFLFSAENFHHLESFRKAVHDRFGPDIDLRTDIGTVTLVGASIAEEPQTHRRITAFLREHVDLIRQVFFSPLSVTFLVERSDVDHLVADVHELFLAKSAGKEEKRVDLPG